MRYSTLRLRSTVQAKRWRWISGQLYEKSDTFRLISENELKAVSIPPKAEHKICICGSATYKLGVEGELDIFSDDPARIASVSWCGSWRRVGNKFEVNNVDTNYSTTASSFNETGSLGEISVTIARKVVWENVWSCQWVTFISFLGAMSCPWQRIWYPAIFCLLDIPNIYFWLCIIIS